MSHEQFGEMVTATMQASLIKKAFGSKNPFDMEYQKKKVKKDRIANAISDSEFNWMTETIPGRDADEYTNQLSQVRPVCAWKTGAFGRTDTLYVCHGFYFC